MASGLHISEMPCLAAQPVGATESTPRLDLRNKDLGIVLGSGCPCCGNKPDSAFRQNWMYF